MLKKVNWPDQVANFLAVIIGVTIAFWLNDWKENRQSERRFQYILQTIQKDLMADTAEVGLVIQMYEDKKPYFDTVSQGLLTEERFERCTGCYMSLILNYNSVDLSQKGYRLLVQAEDNLGLEQDSLIIQLDAFYSNEYNQISTLLEAVGDDVFSNLNMLRDNYVWFSDFVTGEITSRAKAYFLTSWKYRNLVTSHGILVYDNYLQNLGDYRKESAVLLDRINTRLGEKVQNSKTIEKVD